MINIFKKYRKKASPDNKIVILEIGVAYGGSLDLWNAYFGKENCIIYGVDINPICKKFTRDNINVIIGDQGNKQFLNDLKNKIPKPDIMIDDGGHTMTQQINTFDVMFDHIKLGGIYLCEDTHTSYFCEFGGGYKKPSTFIEYSKNFIDSLNGYHHDDIDSITLNCSGIHFYDSMIFFDKSLDIIGKPYATMWHPK